ncbi:MAG: F0F1 ATP synthase subunit B [Actinobacteria bacterium]|nr:MAG: F0F1 ATP synthase subunit B [Actinomycetota bacterium]TML83702.1 MAG: F0F1 ATP synthase subunit B [Actinomycetota bacterium]
MPGFATSALVVLAQASGGSSSGGSSSSSGGGGGGNFLVTPNVGLMIWTLIAFAITLFILRRLAFPRIADALDRRRRAIEESIDAAERTRAEADQILSEYRERLREAREQSEDIVNRARRAADRLEDEAKSDAAKTREELMERTRREIESETRRAIDQIRREVADLTVLATEKVARKTLTGDDHKRLIEETLDEFDFSALAPGEGGRTNGGSAG